MAQCMAASYSWHASLQTSFQQRFSGHVLMRSTMKNYSHSSISSFPSRSVLEDFLLPRFGTEAVSSDRCSPTCSPSIVCFKDDDLPFPEHLIGRSASDLSIRTNSETTYNPWAVHPMNGFGKKQRNKLKESTGAPPGGRSGADDGDGGGGGGEDDGEEHIFVLTLAFAAFHLCVHWILSSSALD